MSILKTSVSRKAQTTYRTYDAGDEASLLECDLHTGRTHQVRVHLRSIGHPILRDPTYATPQSEKLSDQYEIDFLCLHAWKLSFDSPDKGNVETEAQITSAFLSALSSLGLSL